MRRLCKAVCVWVCVRPVSVTCPGFVSWLVRNDRLALSRNPPISRPTPFVYPAHPSALERRQIRRPVLCLRHVGVCVRACARQSVHSCHGRSGWTSEGAQKISRRAFVASVISAPNAKAEPGERKQVCFPFSAHIVRAETQVCLLKMHVWWENLLAAGRDFVFRWNWFRFHPAVKRLVWKCWNWLHRSLFISCVFSVIVDKLRQPSFSSAVVWFLKTQTLWPPPPQGPENIHLDSANIQSSNTFLLDIS